MRTQLLSAGFDEDRCYRSPHHSTDFTGYRSVAAGVVVATCTTPQTLIPIARTSPKALVKRGRRLTYDVRFRSTSPATTLTGLRVEVSLPSYVSIVSTATSPLPNRRNKTSAVGVVSGSVVTWENITIAPKKTRAFRVRMRVGREAPSRTVLSFGATVYQTNASPDGSPYCPMQIQNVTVRTQPCLIVNQRLTKLCACDRACGHLSCPCRLIMSHDTTDRLRRSKEGVPLDIGKYYVGTEDTKKQQKGRCAHA